MNKLKSLTLSVVISFFIFGVLNLFVLNINKQVSNVPEMKTEVLLNYDFKVHHLYGFLVKPMGKVETFYLYNYFDGIFEDYKLNDKSEESAQLNLYKKALLPMLAIATFMIILAMFVNSLRFGRLTSPRNDT